jgi:hypothetical protein
MKLILKAKTGLVAQKRAVTRGGKTFQTTVWVRPNKKQNSKKDGELSPINKKKLRSLLRVYGKIEGTYGLNKNNTQRFKELEEAGIITTTDKGETNYGRTYKKTMTKQLEIKLTPKGKEVVKGIRKEIKADDDRVDNYRALTADVSGAKVGALLAFPKSDWKKLDSVMRGKKQINIGRQIFKDIGKDTGQHGQMYRVLERIK